MSKTHYLKCHSGHFQDVYDGIKLVELRYNDRDYQAGDYLILQEWSPINQQYSGREVSVKVEHILSGGPWLQDGYVAMSIDSWRHRYE